MILSTEEQSSTRREQNTALIEIRTGHYKQPGNRLSIMSGTETRELRETERKGLGAGVKEALGNRLFRNSRRGSGMPGDRYPREPGARIRQHRVTGVA